MPSLINGKNVFRMCNVWQSCREPLAHVMQCEEFISRHACTMHNCLAWYVCKASMKTSQVDQIKASWAHVARKVPQKCMYHAHLPSLIYSILAWQPPCYNTVTQLNFANYNSLHPLIYFQSNLADRKSYERSQTADFQIQIIGQCNSEFQRSCCFSFWKDP